MDRLPTFCPRLPSDLLGASTAALSGNAGSGPARGGGVAARGKRDSPSQPAVTGSSGSEPDQCPRVGDCPRPVGSASGPYLGPQLSLADESTLRQPFAQGTGGDVHLPLLPGVGGDELPGRTSHSSHGSHPQGLGRQSYRKWRTYPERIGQHPTDLPSAAPTSDRILGTIAPSAHTPSLGLDPARSPLNKYKEFSTPARALFRKSLHLEANLLPGFLADNVRTPCVLRWLDQSDLRISHQLQDIDNSQGCDSSL